MVRYGFLNSFSIYWTLCVALLLFLPKDKNLNLIQHWHAMNLINRTRLKWLHSEWMCVVLLKDPNELAPEFHVPGTPYKLRALSTMTDREVHIQFICSLWLKERGTSPVYLFTMTDREVHLWVICCNKFWFNKWTLYKAIYFWALLIVSF